MLREILSVLPYLATLIAGAAVVFGLVWSLIQINRTIACQYKNRVEFRKTVLEGMRRLEQCWVALHNHIPTALHQLELRQERMESKIDSNYQRIERVEQDIDSTLDRVITILEKDHAGADRQDGPA